MRIGVYDPYLDDLGGGEKYMISIAECLSKHHDVSIFWDKKEDLHAVGKRFSIHVSALKVVPNIFSSRCSFLEKIWKTRQYDVIIFLSDGSIPLVLSKKLLIHIQQPLQALRTKSLIDKIKLARVSNIFCNSYYTQKYITKRYGVTASVVYPPVALAPQRIKKENSILHVGRFRSVAGKDYKKQSIMIQAFKEMVDNGLHNWQFTIAASVHEKDRELFQRMKDTAQGYPISFVVNESNKELWTRYSQAKIYWHASGFGEDLEKYPELAEHFGISTVEAMGAGGVPVVVNAGGQKEIVTDGENGFVWDTLSELQQKTLQLIADEKLRERLSKNAQATAEKFSVGEFCRKIQALMGSSK